MDISALEALYNSISHDNVSMQNAIENRALLNALPEYIAIRLEQKYSHSCFPFTKVWRYENRCTVFEGFCRENIDLKIDVWCDLQSYEVHFWASNDSLYDISKIYKSKIELLSDFELNNGNINNLKKVFQCSEQEFVIFLNSFLAKLSVFI